VNKRVPLRNESTLTAAENVKVSAHPTLNIFFTFEAGLTMLSMPVPDASACRNRDLPLMTLLIPHSENITVSISGKHVGSGRVD
jgi:hypothetical protein